VLGPAKTRTCEIDEELIVPGRPVSVLLFPTTLVCSVLIGLRTGQRADMGTVGNEGFVGIPAVLGTQPTEHVVVQTAGEGYEISAGTIASFLDRYRTLHQGLLQYIGHAYHMAQQATVCNAYHSIEQRLARRLLAMHDRSGKDQFSMTQELLSHMVAATRPRVTEAAARLRTEGVIDYQRGRVTIKNREGLESRACECYEATKLTAVQR